MHGLWSVDTSRKYQRYLVMLKANGDKLYHLGIGKAVAVSTLTRANESRSYRIYEELAMQLIKEAKQLYINDNKLDINLKGNVFAIDAGDN